jgi:hypothetical protein
VFVDLQTISPSQGWVKIPRTTTVSGGPVLKPPREAPPRPPPNEPRPPRGAKLPLPLGANPRPDIIS